LLHGCRLFYFIGAAEGAEGMKRKGGNYLHLSREIFNTPKWQQVSINAKWLYVVLNELEHKFTGPKEDFFFRSNEDLAKDAGMSLPTLKRAKKELKESGLVRMWNMHFVDKETGELSKKHITAFRLLE
jgi:hypothetical protein